MKYFIYLLTVLVFAGCNSQNSYDGKNGLISSSSASQKALENLYITVFQKDANSSLNAVELLVASLKDLNETQSSTNLQTAQQRYKDFVLTHKEIEAVFLADSFNESYLDTLGYMDYFHSGKNTDMVSELDTIFDTNTTLSNALYKNSNKSITSLEYTLFGEDENTTLLLSKLSARRAEAALIMGKRIATYTESIYQFYMNDTAYFIDSEESLSELINQLIDSAYKLKEWRIGEAAGLLSSNSGVINYKELEYYKSGFSLDAIEQILLTHQRVMQFGLTQIATLSGAQSEAEAIEQTLSDAIITCRSFDKALKDSLSDEKVTQLYESVNLLQQEYSALISSMNYTQKILEADGD